MKDKQYYVAHRQRLLAKFDDNPESLLDYELIEVLLFYTNMQKDTKPAAKALLKKYPDFTDIMTRDTIDIKGIGLSTARMLKLFNKVYNRIQTMTPEYSETYDSPVKVFNLLEHAIGYSTVENYVVMLMNVKECLIDKVMLPQKHTKNKELLPRYIADVAIKSNTSNVIVVHNHPCGDPTPTKEDKDLNCQIIQSLNQLGINLVDHIIICANNYRSLKALNLM